MIPRTRIVDIVKQLMVLLFRHQTVLIFHKVDRLKWNNLRLYFAKKVLRRSGRDRPSRRIISQYDFKIIIVLCIILLIILGDYKCIKLYQIIKLIIIKRCSCRILYKHITYRKSKRKLKIPCDVYFNNLSLSGQTHIKYNIPPWRHITGKLYYYLN